ncbi:MAG: histidinol-phosphatase, partial [Phycisphaeraceae bacterium]|nr:histidinol-phosphatase [Phycisphaeraceae bacterium]
QGPNASALYESLKNQRIFVRYFDQDRLRDRLRITLGSPEQNTALLNALDRLIPKP